MLVADLGTAPSHPAHETGIVSSRPPYSPTRFFCPIENPGLSDFRRHPACAGRACWMCAALAAARINLAGREGVEPSRASFGDSPDLLIPTFVERSAGFEPALPRW